MESTPGLRPLYRQVYDYLIRQIAEGVWRPAAALPSEQALAAELGVSQGTVRKALDVMAAEQLIERRQGKGTFVAEHTQESALFRFFRIAAPGGKRTTPQCGQETVRLRPARPQEQRHLHLSDNQEIVEIKRTRLIEGVPAIFEIIIIPHALFPGIDQRGELPNTLYSLYQSDYGINIVAAEEELRADVARKEDVRRINVPLGAPLLHIDRVALALDGTRVEWRVSRCDTRDFVYAVTIS